MTFIKCLILFLYGPNAKIAGVNRISTHDRSNSDTSHLIAPDCQRNERTYRPFANGVFSIVFAACITVFCMRFSPAQYRLISCPSGSFTYT